MDNNQQKIQRKKKLLLVGILGVLVLILLTFKMIQEQWGKVQDVVVYVYDNGTDETTFFVAGEKVGAVSGEVSVHTNMNGSGTYIETDNFELFLLHDQKIVQIENCSDIAVEAANSKEAIVVGKAGDVYYYDGNNTEKIAGKDATSVAISGNGKVYAYNLDGDAYFGKEPGKETKVEDVNIMYISENGKYMYGLRFDKYNSNVNYGFAMPPECMQDFYRTGEFELFVIDKDGNMSSLHEEVRDIIAFNESGDEILYTTKDATYISVKGGEPQKVADGQLQEIYYPETVNRKMNYYYPVESFKELVCMVTNGAENWCCFISEDYQVEVITDDCCKIFGMTGNKRKVYYLDDGERLCSAMITGDAEAQVLDDSVASVCISPDGKEIYYTKENGYMLGENVAVYYIKENSEPKVIGTYVGFVDMVMLEDAVYMSVSDKEYYISGGKAAEIDAGHAVACSETGRKAYACNSNAVYELNGNKLIMIGDGFEKLESIDVVN